MPFVNIRIYEGFGADRKNEIARRVSGPYELLKLENCGHSPSRDQPETVLAATVRFIERLFS